MSVTLNVELVPDRLGPNTLSHISRPHPSTSHFSDIYVLGIHMGHRRVDRKALTRHSRTISTFSGLRP